VIVRGGASGLENETVPAPDILQDFHHHFAVGEAANTRPAKRNTQMRGNLGSKFRNRVAGENGEGLGPARIAVMDQ